MHVYVSARTYVRVREHVENAACEHVQQQHEHDVSRRNIEHAEQEAHGSGSYLPHSAATCSGVRAESSREERLAL